MTSQFVTTAATVSVALETRAHVCLDVQLLAFGSLMRISRGKLPGPYSSGVRNDLAQVL